MLNSQLFSIVRRTARSRDHHAPRVITGKLSGFVSLLRARLAPQQWEFR